MLYVSIDVFFLKIIEFIFYFRKFIFLNIFFLILEWSFCIWWDGLVLIYIIIYLYVYWWIFDKMRLKLWKSVLILIGVGVFILFFYLLLFDVKILNNFEYDMWKILFKFFKIGNKVESVNNECYLLVVEKYNDLF